MVIRDDDNDDDAGKRDSVLNPLVLSGEVSISRDDCMEAVSNGVLFRLYDTISE